MTISDRLVRDTYGLYIGGKWMSAVDGEHLLTINPATEKPLAEVAAAQATDVDRAVEVAREAYPAWRDTSPDERGRIIYRIGQLIREYGDELAALESLDQGKPLSQAESDIESAARYFEYYAGAADKVEGRSIPVGSKQVDFTVREPYGVSVQITPWNFPANLFARGVAPALVAGNTTVIKPAEQTPLSTLRLAEICAEAGIPDGVVNVVTGFGKPTGSALTSHPDVDTITFTGSVPTGQAIMKQAANNVTPVTLELGGKNPAIVFPDADLDKTTNWIARAIFTNSGQVCSAADRVVIHEDVHDEFVSRFVDCAESYEIGPGAQDLDMGPLASADQLEKVLRYIEIGHKEGATLATGGNALDRDGFFVEPTVFTDVENDMRIAQEEIFGPVLTVIPFTTESEALEIANDVEYGLVSGIFTDDIKRAHRFAQRLEAGNVYINKWFGDTNQTPFGGYKKSGIGREKGLDALESYLQTKNIAVNIADDDELDLPGA
ncbi:aldehyde dehydrogenase family protein [Natronorubrum aibiense]|uniref:Aldehyde dehydrogenase family protein n=1 Tax=Natronorubrum aibiense TaxID=348826 RepID=A0A5P9P8W5_9EURY|nr:aldehyde dehydrogenase family protein [Natronorubrum aibiense]QFU84548.1 aldehyde dehydrogenase family protein [Natronorubrum aibiense]